MRTRESWVPRTLGMLCALGAVFSAGCGSDDVDPEIVQSAVLIESAGPAPLSWTVSLVTSTLSSLAIELDDGEGHHIQVNYPGQRITHNLLLLGLRPGRTYDATVKAQASTGGTTSQSMTIETDPLPDDFPVINMLHSDPDRMEPGYTQISVVNRSGSPYLAFVDEDGEVVWYLAVSGANETQRVANGNLLTLAFAGTAPVSIRELDMGGNVVVDYRPSDAEDVPDTAIVVADSERWHHEVEKLPDGNYVTSATDVSRTVENFPLDENDESVTGTATIRDEPIVEFSPSGTVVGTWPLLDLLKDTRIGYDGTNGAPGETDMFHVNAIEYDEGNDSFMVSLRHQDAIFSVSRANSELQWILGTPDNWEGFEQYLFTPQGSDFDWPWHTHASMFTKNGNILLFDNGNYQASPFTGDPVTPPAESESRAVEYSIDTENMTIRKTWEYNPADGGEQLFAPIVGDADEMPQTDNVLITWGAICLIDGVPSNIIPQCHTDARIIEVDRQSGDRVMDLSVDVPDGPGVILYRSERESLYPDQNVEIERLP